MPRIKKDTGVVPVEIIQNKIFLIRGMKVMLDRDLAVLYGVSTTRLNQQVKRNLKRFPEDFMFYLTRKEMQNLMLQFATSSWGGMRKRQYVFTEQGIAMLSSLLNSDRAIKVNIQIMRVFTKLRELISSHKDLAIKIKELETKFEGKIKKQDKKILDIFKAIKELLTIKEEENKKRIPIGFLPPPVMTDLQNRSKR